MIRSILIAAFPVLLAACAAIPAAQPVSAQAFVIRHFEKEMGADPVLSATGRTNAERLAERLATEKIVAIFATDTRRARESAEPTARRLGIPISTYAPTDYATLQKKVAAAGGSVLIIGHSNSVPDIVARLSGSPQPAIGDHQYGDLFAVDIATHIVVAARIGD